MKHKQGMTAKQLEHEMNYEFLVFARLPYDINSDYFYFGDAKEEETTKRYELARHRFYKNFKRRKKKMQKIDITFVREHFWIDGKMADKVKEMLELV